LTESIEGYFVLKLSNDDVVLSIFAAGVDSIVEAGHLVDLFHCFVDNNKAQLMVGCAEQLKIVEEVGQS